MWQRSTLAKETLPTQIAGFTPGDLRWSDLSQNIRQCAAVCMLFTPAQNGFAQIVLTRRTLEVRTHKGQVGFAGGRRESQDSGVCATACREASEELGIDEALIQTHGYLPSLPSLGANSVIYPVVATTNVSIEQFKIQPTEVAAVFAISWNELKQSRSLAFRFNIFGNWRSSELFQLDECNVWGLTAAMLFDADLS